MTLPSARKAPLTPSSGTCAAVRPQSLGSHHFSESLREDPESLHSFNLILPTFLFPPHNTLERKRKKKKLQLRCCCCSFWGATQGLTRARQASTTEPPPQPTLGWQFLIRFVIDRQNKMSGVSASDAPWNPNGGRGRDFSNMPILGLCPQRLRFNWLAWCLGRDFFFYNCPKCSPADANVETESEQVCSVPCPPLYSQASLSPSELVLSVL